MEEVNIPDYLDDYLDCFNDDENDFLDNYYDNEEEEYYESDNDYTPIFDRDPEPMFWGYNEQNNLYF